MRKHGEIYSKKVKVGNGSIYMKMLRWCDVHGEIDLFTCDDWHARHEFCNRLEQPSAVGLEIPQAMAQAA